MANYFYLRDDNSNTYVLDTNATTLEISGTDRDYSVSDYTGANGGAIKGFGKYSSKTITFAKRETKNSTAVTAWNAARDTLLAWFTRPSWDPVYFCILNGEGTKTVETRIYPQKIGGEKMSHYAVFGEKSLTWISPTGIFQKTTSSNTTQTLSAMTETTKTFTVGGNCETPCTVSFTPSSDATKLKAEIGLGQGFQIEKTVFPSGKAVVYNTANNTLTIDGVTVNLSQYLTAGSGFNLQAGSNSVVLYCDVACAVTITWYERFI